MKTIPWYLLATLCWMQLLGGQAAARTWRVGPAGDCTTIKVALTRAADGDTIFVSGGIYREGNITIDKAVCLLGEGWPVLDGQLKYEVLSVRSSAVTVKGFCIRNSGRSALNDPGAIKIYDASSVVIEGNLLVNNYFGIYLQYARNCVIKGNIIRAAQKLEHQSGNGIHCWKSDSLQILGNKVEGHRDGIYFEFVTASVIWRNISRNNLRYGLHFMFSHNNAYITNFFKSNGAGVAVMFTKKVVMINNVFEDNRGDAAYGILFKELSDCYLSGNRFIKNTTGIFFDGSNRVHVERNTFESNGWGMRMQANCVDNQITHNNFLGNTFDVATNGTLTLNHFENNYWDKYEGYDLNKDGIGDVPYHPLSLYAVMVEKSPPAMLLYRSFMMSLLDRSEKILPSITPEQFVDNTPAMHPFKL